MATILITGGTGLIGRALTTHLTRLGYQVIILTRDPAKAKPLPGVRYASWDIGRGTIDAAALAEADALVHLAGAGVAEKRWSEKRKKEIVDSRVDSGALLVKAIGELPNKIKVVVGASAIGYYGPDPAVPNTAPFQETDQPNDDFLGRTCVLWENSLHPLKERLRLVQGRIGIVLANDGGAMEEFRKPLKFGIATILGNGKQVISWIHVDDVIRFITFAIEHESIHGVYNLVAPVPVSNKELIMETAKQFRGKYFIPVYVPSFALKLALGDMSIEVLKSATVSSKKLQLSGFTFLHPSVSNAVTALAGKA